MKIIKLIFTTIVISNLISLAIIRNKFIKKKLKSLLVKSKGNIDKFTFIKNIKIFLSYIKIKNVFLSKFFSIYYIISISFFISIITFFFLKNKIQIISTTLLISVFSFFLPYIVIKFIYDKKKSDIIQIFPTYIVSLKNYTQVSNDIIVAMKKTIPPEEIKKNIETFNFSVESGISVYDAFENLKEKFNIGKINDFFSSCQYCYINGGNFTKLLDKYAKILNKRNIQIEKEKQENFSSKIVMYIMIAINIYMLFGFSFSTVEYKQIMTQTLVGKVIVNINIISYIIMFIISNKFNKVEE